VKYLLDFDRTLFDTNSCYTDLALKWGEPLQFTPELWSRLSASDYLYSEVKPWFATKDSADVIIITAFTPEYGPDSKAYQAEKVKSSGLSEEVSRVIVMEGEKGQTVKSVVSTLPVTEKVVFVDDRIEQCLSVKRANPEVIVCLMVRDRAVIGDVSSVQGIYVVHCLRDVDDVINKV